MFGKRFRLEGKAYFYALDIDDAFAKLAAYFQALADGTEDSSELFSPPSELTIQAEGDENGQEPS